MDLKFREQFESLFREYPPGIILPSPPGVDPSIKLQQQQWECSTCRKKDNPGWGSLCYGSCLESVSMNPYYWSDPPEKQKLENLKLALKTTAMNAKLARFRDTATAVLERLSPILEQGFPNGSYRGTGISILKQRAQQHKNNNLTQSNAAPSTSSQCSSSQCLPQSNLECQSNGGQVNTTPSTSSQCSSSQCLPQSNLERQSNGGQVNTTQSISSISSGNFIRSNVDVQSNGADVVAKGIVGTELNDLPAGSKEDEESCMDMIKDGLERYSSDFLNAIKCYSKLETGLDELKTKLREHASSGKYTREMYINDGKLIKALIRLGWSREKKFLYYFKGGREDLVKTLHDPKNKNLKIMIDEWIARQQLVENKFKAETKEILDNKLETDSEESLEKKIYKVAEKSRAVAPFGIKYDPTHDKSLKPLEYSKLRIDDPGKMLAQISYLGWLVRRAYNTIQQDLLRKFRELENILFHDDPRKLIDHDICQENSSQEKLLENHSINLDSAETEGSSEAIPKSTETSKLITENVEEVDTFHDKTEIECDVSELDNDTDDDDEMRLTKDMCEGHQKYKQDLKNGVEFVPDEQLLSQEEPEHKDSTPIKLTLTTKCFKCLMFYEPTSMDPEILSCIIGLKNPLKWIEEALLSKCRFVQKLKALVLLVPSSKRTDIFLDSFKSYFSSLTKCNIYSKTTSRYKYGSGIKDRQIVILATYPLGHPKDENLLEEVYQKINDAYNICDFYFQSSSKNTFSNGVHATPRYILEEIIKALKPEKIAGSSIMEIGVGYPRLACTLSALSGKPVLCNDICNVIDTIKACIQVIKVRSLSNQSRGSQTELAKDGSLLKRSSEGFDSTRDPGKKSIKRRRLIPHNKRIHEESESESSNSPNIEITADPEDNYFYTDNSAEEGVY